jgi:hypothetical protein
MVLQLSHTWQVLCAPVGAHSCPSHLPADIKPVLSFLLACCPVGDACSESQLGMPARLNAVRLLDGRSSFGSTLSSVGTPSTRLQDLSTSDWPASR